MAKAIRLMTVQRGFDPREFSLLAFGGAGPLHAVDLARELQIPEVIVPPSPGLTSAMGLLFVDLVHNFSQSLVMLLREADLDLVEHKFRVLEQHALDRMQRERFRAEQVTLLRHADMRYVGQVRALTVPLDGGVVTRKTLDTAAGRFHEQHRREYRYVMEDVPVEMSILRVSAIGPMAKPGLRADGGRSKREDGVVGKRRVYFGSNHDFLETQLYERSKLRPGAVVEGPAVIEQFDSTTVLPPGTRGQVDPVGNLLIRFLAH
jgi:N-methylhydantoinase A